MKLRPSSLKIIISFLAITFMLIANQNCGGGSDGSSSGDGNSSGGENNPSSGEPSSNPVASFCSKANNFIEVPGNNDYNTKNFCVMKYEAKNDGDDNAVSKANGIPWVSISRDDAISKCKAMGDGYDLISNDQWQTLARNIELVNKNWYGGTVGRGCIFQGNYTYSEGTTDDCSYHATEDIDSGENRDEKAKLTLSNDEEIFDLSGNVAEWIKDNPDNTNYRTGQTLISGGVPGLFFSNVIVVSGTTGSVGGGPQRNLKTQFGPKGDYSSLNSGAYGGLGFAQLLFSNGDGIARGGYYGTDIYDAYTPAGVFTVDFISTDSNAEVGFRCVYDPGTEESD